MRLMACSRFAAPDRHPERNAPPTGMSRDGDPGTGTSIAPLLWNRKSALPHRVQPSHEPVNRSTLVWGWLGRDPLAHRFPRLFQYSITTTDALGSIRLTPSC